MVTLRVFTIVIHNELRYSYDKRIHNRNAYKLRVVQILFSPV